MAVVGALDVTDLRAVAYVGGATGALGEEVLGKVWDVSRIPLEFQDRVGTGSATSNYHEWIKDKLRAAAANAWVENSAIAPAGTGTAPTDIGDSASVSNVERLRNICQISAVNVTTSFRSQAVAGNQVKSLAYQLQQRMRELKQDQEYILLGNTASLVGNSTTTAPLCGSYLSWVEDKTTPTQNLFIDAGSGSTQGGYDTTTGLTVAATFTTSVAAAALTETDIRDACEAIYNGGAQATVLMCRTPVKAIISKYMYTSSARIASLVSDVGQGKDGQDVARGAVSVFVSDFGVVEIVANRLQPTLRSNVSSCYLFDPQYLSVDYLQTMRTTPVDKQGLCESRTMFVDYTLKVGNDQCVAAIVNIDETAAMTA